MVVSLPESTQAPIPGGHDATPAAVLRQRPPRERQREEAIGRHEGTSDQVLARLVADDDSHRAVPLAWRGCANALLRQRAYLEIWAQHAHHRSFVNEVISHHEASLHDYAAEQNCWQRAKMMLYNMWRLLSSVRAFATGLLHPATSLACIWNDAFLPENERDFARMVAWLRPQSIITPDGTLLDAMMVQKPGSQSETWPICVMALGNKEQYEEELDKAISVAKRLCVRVLFFNGRGVARSLGHEITSADQVSDAEAVLRFAAARSKRLAIVGFSLGAASATVAAQRLFRKGVLVPGQLGLLINQRSFSNLENAAARWFATGKMVGPTQLVLRAFIFCTGADKLSAEEALRNHSFATQVVVTTLQDDEIIRAGARLGPALRTGPQPKSNIAYIDSPGVDHGDLSIDLDPLNRHLRAWRDACEPPRDNSASRPDASTSV